MVHIPQPAPQDLSLRSKDGGPDPHVDETPPLQGLLLFTLRMINGRLERARQHGNNGLVMRHHQSRTWLLSCISHFPDSSPQEREHIREIIEETCDLSDDDESPWHNRDELEMQLAISMNHKAFEHTMGLLEYDTYEVTIHLVQMVGEAMRSKRPTVPSEDDESMEGETEEQRVQRHAGCGMSEASDPDFWQEIRYGPQPPTPFNDTGLMEF